MAEQVETLGNEEGGSIQVRKTAAAMEPDEATDYVNAVITLVDINSRASGIMVGEDYAFVRR